MNDSASAGSNFGDSFCISSNFQEIELCIQTLIQIIGGFLVPIAMNASGSPE
jgi:hypothetical protein